MAITPEQIQRIAAFEAKPIPKYPYWYGMKKAVYTCAGLPNWWPASVHLQHGVALWLRKDEPDQLALNSRYPILFVNNKYEADIYRSKISKPIYVLGSIFPRYRRHKNIEQLPEAKGTIAYPLHATKDISIEFDWAEYAKSLKALPDCYQPVTVSLYFLDIQKGYHKIFEDEGLEVVCNGHISDADFIDNFYKNLSRHRYTTGNEMGSNFFLAVEMGIPSFIYGPHVRYVNHGNKDMPEGVLEGGSAQEQAEFPLMAKASRMFDYSEAEIAAGVQLRPEQTALVDELTGKYDSISDADLQRLIRPTLWPHLLFKTPIDTAKMMVRSLLKRFQK